MLLPALLSLLLTGSASAGPTEDLDALEAQVAALDGVSIDGDPVAMKAELVEATRTLSALRDLAAESARGAPPDHVSAVGVLLAEGHLSFVEALLDAPCPAQLNSEACAVYSSMIADKAQVLTHPAEDALRRAGGAAEVAAAGRRAPRSTQRALRRLDARLGRARARIAVAQAAAPEPSASPRPPASPPPPTTALGAPAPLPAGWTPAPRPATYREEPRADPDLRWALVDKTAWLTAHADGSGLRARSRVAPPEGPEPQPMLARLLREEGGRAELELGSGDHRLHCAYDPPFHHDVAVRMWVDTAALLPVTTRPLERRFDDGTGYQLRPGAPIVEQGVWAEGLLLPIDVPADARGRAYAVTDAFAPELEGSEDVNASTRLSLGGTPLAWPMQTWHGGPGRAHRARLVEGSTTDERLDFHTACGRVTLAATGRLEEEPEAGGGMGGVFGSLRDGPAVRVLAGTHLVWPDGSAAGVMRLDKTMKPDELQPSEGGLQCFDQPLDHLTDGEADHTGRHLTLCVRPAQ